MKEIEGYAIQVQAKDNQLKEKEQNIRNTVNERVKDEVKFQTKNLKAKIHTPFLISLLYGIGLTLFLAIRSKAFRTDFSGFCVWVWEKIFVGSFKGYTGLIGRLSTLALNIPHTTAATIVKWVIIVLGVALAIVVLFYLFRFVRFVVKNYIEHIADLTSLAVLLVTLAVMVAFCDLLTGLPIFVTALFLIINLIYSVIRFIIVLKQED